MLLNGDIGRLELVNGAQDGDQVVILRDGVLYRSENTSASLENTIFVQSASDIGDKTLDSSKVYFIDGDIDMGSSQVYVPEGGLTIISDDYDLKGLRSTADNYTMFVADPSGSYADS